MCCPGHGDPVSHLEELRQELTGRGWITSLLEQNGRSPALFVQNPDPQVTALSDHVLVAPLPGGGCWFWWPWASRIAPAAEVTRAADRVTHVLRATVDREAERA
jgi:hypothetical protein